MEIFASASHNGAYEFRLNGGSQCKRKPFVVAVFIAFILYASGQNRQTGFSVLFGFAFIMFAVCLAFSALS